MPSPEVNVTERIAENIFELFSELNQLVASYKGLMLFVGFNQEEIDVMDSGNLTHIPSFDEAVDYIFMDQLEKELGAE